jgi:hypothetical protein
MKQLANLDFGGVARALNLPAAASDGEPATLGQLNAVIAGLKWKNSARVSTQANLSLASPGGTIDGIAMSAGDRVLVRAQSTASQNGIYVWNGAATPMTRSLDADTFAELEGAAITVEEGTSGGVQYRQTQVNGTIGASDVAWTTIGSAAPDASETTAGLIEIATQAETNTGTDDARALTPAKARNASWMVKKFVDPFGDASNTQYDVVHNLGSRDVVVSIRETAAPYEFVQATVSALDTNTVRVVLAAAPGNDALTATVIG